jgi:ectoine hydroxylase-related dioxygenase (phytanoyl-CoA dioxygenase family)
MLYNPRPLLVQLSTITTCFILLVIFQNHLDFPVVNGFAPTISQPIRHPISILSSSAVSDDSPPSLYKEQERLLVDRGIIEAELMKDTGSGIISTVVQGANSAKGFASFSSSSSSGGSSSSRITAKLSEIKFAAAAQSKELRTVGVVRIDNVLTNDMADDMRRYVFDLRQESEELVRTKVVPSLARFANVLLKENRCDVTIPLEEKVVIDSLLWLLEKSPVGYVVSSIFGKDATLQELSCLISDPGSQRQVVHPDTPYGADDEPVMLTCFIALQDVKLEMGPTTWLPRTHTREAHEQFRNESVDPRTGESSKDKLLRTTPAVLGLLPKGSCAIFDSRLLHCGGANISTDQRRALFYCSFKNPTVGYPGNPGSIRRELLSKYTLATLIDDLKTLQKQYKKKK